MDRGHRFIETGHLLNGLERRSASSAAVVLGLQAAKFTLGFISTIVLARLIVPEVWGLVAAAMVFIKFGNLVRDFGFSTAIVQKEDITHEQVSNLFWANLAIGLGLTLTFSAASPFISTFYDDARLTVVATSLSAMFATSAIATTHVALLRRQMKFRQVAAIEISTSVSTLAVTIAFAAAGYGLTALVLQNVFAGLVQGALAWSFCRWRPDAPSRDVPMKGLLRFGGAMTAFSILNFIAQNIDLMLMGRMAGAHALGTYEKAQNLLLTPTRQLLGPVGVVMLPALSRAMPDPTRYRHMYVFAVEKLALVVAGGCAFAAVSADLLIPALLGPAWADTAPIFTALAAYGFVLPLLNPTGWLFISQGRVAELVRWSGFAAVVRTLSVVAGLPWGAIGVASVCAATGIVILAPALLFYVSRKGPVGIRDHLDAGFPGLCAAVMLVCAGLGLRANFTFEPDLSDIVALYTLMLLAAFPVFVALPSCRRCLVEAHRLAANLILTRLRGRAVHLQAGTPS